MTLVVCKNLDGNIRFESDTLIWNDEVKKMKPVLEGKLKTVILHQHCCLAFAGDEDIAWKAIVDIRSTSSPLSYSEIIGILTNASISGAQFILASLVPEPEIVEVKNGQSERSSTAWIGNQHAFSEFQRLWLPALAKAVDQREQSHLMSKVFERVVQMGIEGVGGFRVSVGSKDGHFCYRAYTSVYLPKQVVPAGMTILSIKETGFALSCLRSEQGSPPGIAFYINPIRLGLLLTAANKDFTSIKGLNEQEFVNHIKSVYKIPLAGLISRLDGTMLTIGQHPVSSRLTVSRLTDLHWSRKSWCLMRRTSPTALPTAG